MGLPKHRNMVMIWNKVSKVPGSGCFLSRNLILTAAHVLYPIFYLNQISKESFDIYPAHYGLMK